MTQLKDYSNSEARASFSSFLSKVFTIVFVGLLITTAVAYGTYLFIQSNLEFFAGISFFVLIIQFVIAIFFSFRIMSMSKGTAWLCYGLYSASMGVTFAMLPLIYDGNSIIFAVLMTAVLFGCMTVIGHTTKIDLSKFSSLFMIGLIAILVISLVNMIFIHSSGIDMMLNYAGVILFLGLIAWDMQRMRGLYLEGIENPELGEKMAILGAFQLYVDFLNLFLRILAIFGKKDD